MRSDVAGADYRRARRRAFMRGVMSWFRRSDNALLAFDEVRRGIHAQAQRDGGLREVPIDQIVGTAELTTCFDRCFRPTSEVPRARFEWLAAAVLSGRGMEPVELYHCGGRYYVLDGRHRIAVARALGERSVCANVTEVRLNKPDKPRSNSSA